MSNTDTLVRGAKAGGAGVAGALLLGPTIGPVASGFVAQKMLDGRKAPYLASGVAMGLGSLFLGGAAGGSGSGGVM